jgi:2-oxoglutarate ferredoxin oxidoreductase subunit alpha
VQEALAAAVASHASIVETKARSEARWCEDATTVVVGFGMPSRFARAAVRGARERGERVGFFRPVTLWPFPSEQLRAACATARVVKVFEVNNGQMIDDVRLALNGSAEVEFIGGISTDRSGFGVGDILDVGVVAGRI